MTMNLSRFIIPNKRIFCLLIHIELFLINTPQSSSCFDEGFAFVVSPDLNFADPLLFALPQQSLIIVLDSGNINSVIGVASELYVKFYQNSLVFLDSAALDL